MLELVCEIGEIGIAGYGSPTGVSDENGRTETSRPRARETGDFFPSKCIQFQIVDLIQLNSFIELYSFTDLRQFT